MDFYCSRCRRTYAPDPPRVRCDCGGVLDLRGAPALDPAQIRRDDWALWRYRRTLPIPPDVPPVTLGEGMTPLVEARWGDLPVLLKCEFLNPTGSFKGRGTTVLVTALAAAGVGYVVEDSSGNAGCSLAAYAARAGIRAAIYVPAHASPVKQAQIAAYGAQRVAVPGPRSQAARAVLEAAASGAVYASHVYHPLIHAGMKTAAYEIWEQLGGRLPDAVVLPVGHGSLLLGLAQGFAELGGRMPRLFGVQAAACAPLAAAWEAGAADPSPSRRGRPSPRGCASPRPCAGGPFWRRSGPAAGPFSH